MTWMPPTDRVVGYRTIELCFSRGPRQWDTRVAGPHWKGLQISTPWWTVALKLWRFDPVRFQKIELPLVSIGRQESYRQDLREVICGTVEEEGIPSLHEQEKELCLALGIPEKYFCPDVNRSSHSDV